MPVTEQPMIRPCLRTPRYHLGPILFSCTSWKPALVNQSIYSSSVGNSIHTSAKNRDSQNVGCTGPMRHALPPFLSTLYASLIPRCGSGQYSMLLAPNATTNICQWLILKISNKISKRDSQQQFSKTQFQRDDLCSSCTCYIPDKRMMLPRRRSSANTSERHHLEVCESGFLKPWFQRYDSCFFLQQSTRHRTDGFYQEEESLQEINHTEVQTVFQNPFSERDREFVLRDCIVLETKRMILQEEEEEALFKSTWKRARNLSRNISSKNAPSEEKKLSARRATGRERFCEMVYGFLGKDLRCRQTETPFVCLSSERKRATSILKKPPST